MAPTLHISTRLKSKGDTMTAPTMHPLDAQTADLIADFIAQMSGAGIAEQRHVFGHFSTHPHLYLEPMPNVTATGWYIPTDIGPAPGYVVTRDNHAFPLTQPRNLAQCSVPRVPHLELPLVADNPALEEWTHFLHSCIREAAGDYIDQDARAASLDDRAGIQTVRFINRMRHDNIAPTRQTFIHLDDLELDEYPEAQPLAGIETTGWLLQPSPNASITNCDNEPLDPADRSYVITPEGSAYYLRQPSALAYTDATQPTARVPEAHERPFVGPLNEIEGSRAQDADEIEDYIATICYSIDIHDAAITEAQPSRRR